MLSCISTRVPVVLAGSPNWKSQSTSGPYVLRRAAAYLCYIHHACILYCACLPDLSPLLQYPYSVNA